MRFKKNVIVSNCVLGLMVLSLGLSLGACASSVQKANIATTANPQEEVSKLETDIQQAKTKNIDILAPDYFKMSVSSLNDAKKDLANNKKQETVLDDIRAGRGALQKAFIDSENHEALAPSLFAARQATMTAGAADHPELRSDLRELDADTTKISKSLAKASSQKLADLQNRYMTLEKRAVILNQLGKAKGIVNGAKKDSAAKKAPQTLKKAEMSLQNAESSIATNVRNPQGFEKSVATADNDATLLLDVMTMSKENGKNLPEATALRLVGQNRQITGLKSDLTTSTAEGAASANANAVLASDLRAKSRQIDGKNREIEDQSAALAAGREMQDATNQELADTNSELESSDNALNSANAKVEIQRAIEKARTQFSKGEAEAYQQGDSLLIRLKTVGFASGRSELPESSLALLAKVSEVAKSLNASAIKVEGHTDSVGSEKQNMAVSTARASAVATYLKSNGFNQIQVDSQGYGFEKPISTNKSKDGRAQNRRVDVIITPQTAL